MRAKSSKYMMLKTAPVAVLDSGIGGIGVLRELKKILPYENFLYFGDSANAPYGERPPAEIYALVSDRANRLLTRAKALVLACNTATAVAAERLRRERPEPIIGMEPALHPASLFMTHPRILVLATKATIRGEKFEALCAANCKNAEISVEAAPFLVRLAESGKTECPAAEHYLRTLLAAYAGTRFDAVVLGCTHFPLFKNAVTRALGYSVAFFDGAIGTARETARRLADAGLLHPSSEKSAAGTLTTTPIPSSLAKPQPVPEISASAPSISLPVSPLFPPSWGTGRVLITGTDKRTLPFMRTLFHQST